MALANTAEVSSVSAKDSSASHPPVTGPSAGAVSGSVAGAACVPPEAEPQPARSAAASSTLSRMDR